MTTYQPTSIRFLPETKAYLKKVCKAQGCSMLWLVNDIVLRWIAWHRSTASAQAEAEKKK